MSYQQTQPVYQQPTATQGMQPVAGGNRNAKNLPVSAEGREWSNDFFDCFSDVGTCVIAWCFPCVIYGQNKQRLEHLTSKGTPDPERGGALTGDCVTHGALTCCGCGWILQIGTRGAVRARYNIRGDGMTDCCTAFCCTPCQLTQESREILLEEESFAAYKA